MSSQPERPTAQILDFTQYRLRRAARSGEVAPRRQFLWSWPASGQVTLIDFPSETEVGGRQGSADPLAR